MKIIIKLLLLLILPHPLYAQQILPTQTLEKLRKALPHLNNPIYHNYLHSQYTIWYNRSTMGVVYQFDNSNPSTIRRNNTQIKLANARFNISGEVPESQKPSGSFQGGNLNTLTHFPWSPKPGGVQESPNVSSFKGLLLPTNPNTNKLYPIAHKNISLEGFLHPSLRVKGFDLIYPLNTVFIELLTLKNPSNNKWFFFEIRFRHKITDGWEFHTFVPFPTADDLKRELEPFNFSSKESFLTFLSSNKPKFIKVSAKNTPGNPRFNTKDKDAFFADIGIEYLPPLPPQIIETLLTTTTFKDTNSNPWKTNIEAPSTRQNFHIVPRNSLLGITRDNCNSCHNTTLVSSRRFNANNGTYGWVRGNFPTKLFGGIFSFHPYNINRINAIPQSFQNVGYRPEFQRHGIVQDYNPNIHKPPIYQILRD